MPRLWGPDPGGADDLVVFVFPAAGAGPSPDATVRDGSTVPDVTDSFVPTSVPSLIIRVSTAHLRPAPT